jgi:hypothetical protein
MLCGTESIPANILHIHIDIWGMFCGILSVPHNIVVDLNIVLVEFKDGLVNSTMFEMK